MASAKSGRATLEQVARQASKRKAGALSPCPSVSRPSKKAKGPLVQPIPAGERDISSNCTVVYQPGAVEHADGSFKYLQVRHPGSYALERKHGVHGHSSPVQLHMR